MKKKKKETRGRKQLYGEPTEMLQRRVPVTHKKRLAKMLDIELLKLQSE